MKYVSFALKCPRYGIFYVALVFPGCVGQEFIFPACHWVSQRKKRWLLKQHILPLTCLLPTEHVISHHNSGLLLQIQQSAWPGLWEHSDRYQTRDGWHTTRTLTVSPFSLFFYMSAWIPYKMQSQWCMLQVAKDCTSGWDMHLFSSLARWQSLRAYWASTKAVRLCCYDQTQLIFSPTKLFFFVFFNTRCISAGVGKIIL